MCFIDVRKISVPVQVTREEMLVIAWMLSAKKIFFVSALRKKAYYPPSADKLDKHVDVG